MSTILFGIAVVILIAQLAGAVWSIAVPDRRLWPPPGRGSWQHLLTWAGFWAVIGINVLLLLMYWNSWVFQSPLRFIIGVPLVVLGGLLAVWGVVTVGWKNTSGLKGGFVSTGPYRFTRNPQYLGDIVLLRGRECDRELAIAVDHAPSPSGGVRGCAAGRGAVAGGAVRRRLPGVSEPGSVVSVRTGGGSWLRAGSSRNPPSGTG